MWFLGDGDKVLAAEPGDHGAPPGGGAGVVIGHFPFLFEHALRVSADPVENFMTIGAGPPLCLVVEIGLGGGEAGEAAARSCVVEMDDGADERQEFGDFRHGLVRVEGRINGAFERADAMFDGPIVGRVSDRAVEWHDACSGKEAIEDGSVERCAIVALEQQRRAVAAAKTLEPIEVVPCGFGHEEQRFEVEVGGEVTSQHDHHAGIGG